MIGPGPAVYISFWGNIEGFVTIVGEQACCMYFRWGLLTAIGTA